MNTPANPVDDETLKELAHSIMQSGYYDYRSDDYDQELEKNMQAIAAWHSQGVGEAVKLVEDKFKKLEHGIFAVLPLLDKPYPDDPRWTPYERFIHPREIMVREALKGNDVGELWAMGRAAEYKETRKGSQS